MAAGRIFRWAVSVVSSWVATPCRGNRAEGNGVELEHPRQAVSRQQRKERRREEGNPGDSSTLLA
jgi:hypothetical protein